jgi:hypothetical protein
MFGPVNHRKNRKGWEGSSDLRDHETVGTLVRFVNKTYYQAFGGVLIDLIVELLVLIKTFDNQTES